MRDHAIREPGKVTTSLLFQCDAGRKSLRFRGMKPMRKPAARLFVSSTIRNIPLAIIYSLSVNSRFKANRSLLLVSLFVVGAVSTAAPAPAGSGGFNSTGSMNVARVNHTATLLSNGEVFVAGGNNNSTGYLSSAELYNPSTGKWTLTGNMTIARTGHEAVLLPNGEVLVAGGLDPNACCGASPLASAELYNPVTGSWTATGSMTTGRESFVLGPCPAPSCIIRRREPGPQPAA